MSKLKWLGVVAVIVAAFLVGTLGVRWVYDLTGQANRPSEKIDPTAPANPTAMTISTDAIISSLQNYLKTHPEDAVADASLGNWYLQKVRETGDPAYYPKAEAALNRALQLDPNNFDALSGIAVLALARHQFRDGLVWGQRAQPLNPANAGVYGIMGDAQIELGHYPEAFALFDAMVSHRPDLASYARVSYARELQGNLPGAIEAMQAAVDAGADGSEAESWARTQLGDLYFRQGDLTNAEQQYQSVLNLAQNYQYARAGLANVRAAQGNYTEAISLYTTAITVMPLPQFVIALGDIYAADGRPQDAGTQYGLVEVEEKIFAANGVDVDADLALFDADHNRNLPTALEQARAAYARRPSITVADVLAWTLYKSGDYAEAQQLMNQALRTGYRNALVYYHAGMIAYKLGDKQTAMDYLDQAVALNPHFSILYADSAKQVLAELYSSTLESQNLEIRSEGHQ